METLIELGVFTAKALLIIAGIITVIAAIFFFATRGRGGRRELEVDRVNDRYQAYTDVMQSQLMERKEFKAFEKGEKKKRKAEGKKARRRFFVIDFDGDIRASAVDDLREEVTAILAVARPEDEVIVKIESPGGTVTGYGLAAAQLKRIRERGIQLTACVDKVAASGGYMMACVANRIVAAPFAIVGSVGVVASLANFHRLIEKHDVDYHEVTAGEFKRTVSLFGEITPAGFEKFKEQIQDTHILFKSFVAGNRPKLDINKIATGEYWYGTQALDLGLIDELITSDDYLWKLHEAADILEVSYHARKPLSERLPIAISQSFYNVAGKFMRDLWMSRFGV